MPETMSASYNYNGNFDALRLESTNNGLELSADTYTVEDLFSQDGSFQSKVSAIR